MMIAHTMKGMKRNITSPGLASRSNGEDKKENTNMGESTETEGLLRVIDNDMEGQVPTDNGQWRSGCSGEMSLPELSFVKEPVSILNGGIREGTTLKSILPEARAPDKAAQQQTECKYINSEGLGFEPNKWLHNNTQGEQLQMRTGMGSNYSYDQQVLETAREDNLHMGERLEDNIYSSSDESDYESYGDESEVIFDQSETAIGRSADLVDIDCLTPENIKLEQDKHDEMYFIKEWKKEGKVRSSEIRS